VNQEEWRRAAPEAVLQHVRTAAQYPGVRLADGAGQAVLPGLAAAPASVDGIPAQVKGREGNYGKQKVPGLPG